MSDCNHDCGSCGQSCADRDPKSFLKKPHEKSDIKKVIAVVSGKGGVGKSLVTALNAVTMQRRNKKVGILDADITGPSVPRMFGVTDKAFGDEEGLYPLPSTTGIDLMSINLLLPSDTDPVVWRGPVIAGTVEQFWTDVIWGEKDYLFVDMPPGTGDVPLTVFQSLPVDGIIIVTSPQELVGMIVEKAVKMANLMNIPVIGIVENMSYFECPNCKEKHYIYGESHIDDIAERYDIKNIAKIPMDPNLAACCDGGAIEVFAGDWLEKMADAIESL